MVDNNKPSESVNLTPIGVVRSPYKEKFAVPRQPGLVSEGVGSVELLPPYHQAEMVRGLAQFSHIWLIFLFHHNQPAVWHPTVRPPRLGGNQRLGVLASRSPFRPNPLGLSLVELLAIECQADKLVLQLGSIDLVDGTPILDIKPYLPYAESVPSARAGFAQLAPAAQLTVQFSRQAAQQLAEQQALYPQLRRLIEQVLAQDPRPAYHQQQTSVREYGMQLLDFNIRWTVRAQQVEVVQLTLLS